MKNLLVLASGRKDGGGSGLEKLIEASHSGALSVKIVGVVSNHEKGGVFQIAEDLHIPFFYSPKGRTAVDYQNFVRKTDADFVALSGWLGMVEGLDPKTTFNIHPAWLPSPFGGPGMHGEHIHKAVMEAYRRGEVTHSGVTMHFVVPGIYDSPKGIFFRHNVQILANDTSETLARRVNKVEHLWQAIMTDRVVRGLVHWDGENPESVVGADLDEAD